MSERNRYNKCIHKVIKPKLASKLILTSSHDILHHVTYMITFKISTAHDVILHNYVTTFIFWPAWKNVYDQIVFSSIKKGSRLHLTAIMHEKNNYKHCIFQLVHVVLMCYKQHVLLIDQALQLYNSIGILWCCTSTLGVFYLTKSYTFHRIQP